MIDAASLRPQVIPVPRPDHSAAVSIALVLLAGAGGLALVAAGVLPLLILIGGLLSLGLIVATAYAPMVGLVTLLLAIPLTTGLPRGMIVPLLRTNEVVLVLVTFGLLLHFLPRRERRPFSGLDVAVISFAVGMVAIPSIVIFVGRIPASIDVWRVVISPLQYLLIYFLFSRAWLTGQDVRLLLNLSMAASIVIAVVSAAQLADLPGVRDFLATYFPTTALHGICEGDVCRPTSLLEHWSGVGAFAVLNYTVALALATYRTRGFSGLWLGLVMAMNVGDVFLSQTQAAVVGLLIATVAIAWHGRRIPWRELALTIAGLLLIMAIFLPQIMARVEQQVGPQSVSIVAPESLQTRLRYWGEFFLPELAENVWTGTGTVIPSEVPVRLENYVDNQYLATGFRGGILAEVLLAALMVTIGASGWRRRHDPDPWRRVFGGTAFAFILVLLVMGVTAEYLTYAGVAQQFWLVVALLASLTLYRTSIASRSDAVVLGADLRSKPSLHLFDLVRPVGQLAVRLGGDGGLLRSSTLLFAGNAAARGLGFLFSVSAARILLPADYGLLAYALAVVTIASVLVWNAPTGLSRFLARSRNDPEEQDHYFTNWMVVVAILLGVSLVVMIPAARFLGLTGLLMLGLLANLVGLAVLQAYREAQRGQERYLEVTSIYVLANLLQLFGLIAAALMGWRDPGLALIIYGLSSVAAFAIIEPVRPLGLRFVRGTISAARLRMVLRFIAPLVIQTALFTVWIGADLILVQRMLGSALAGNYAAAKAFATLLILAPSAVAIGLGPRLARMSPGDVPRFLVGALRLTALITVPALAMTIILGRPLLMMLFGSKYPLAAQPLTILAIGMACYGVYLILETAWVSLGRPVVDAVATGAGLVVTIAFGTVLIPFLSLRGAALAFTVGALMQLMLITGFTLYVLRFPRMASRTS